MTEKVCYFIASSSEGIILDHPQIILKPGREKPVRQHHPWIFSGAIAKEPKAGSIEPGSIVDIVDSKGQWLAKGYYNLKSQIRCRVLSWVNEPIDPTFWAKKIGAACQRRMPFFKPGSNDALRMVFSESDGLPGLVADLYGEVLVIQLLSAGTDRVRAEIVAGFQQGLPHLKGIYERSDDQGRKLEGLEFVNGVAWGECPSDGVTQIHENGLGYEVDFAKGHKTGFYIDQRDSREWLRGYAAGKSVLNCFAYTGGFSVAAAVGGATSVTSVDVSGPALTIAKRNATANSVGANLEWVEADVFAYLRQQRDSGRKWDVIVLDPPKFAQHAGQINQAARGYKDILMQAIALLNPGGRVATFSCSGHISEDLFQKICFGATVDAGVTMQIVKKFMQAPDHPVALNFPESFYLKGLLLELI